MSQLNSWLSSHLQNSDRSYWKRCWRGSVNGWHTQTFHQLCDDLGPTVTIVRAYGYIFGGYTDKSWKCMCSIKNIILKRSVLLSLDRAVFK